MTQVSVVVIDRQRTFADALTARLVAEPGLTVVAATESVASVQRLLAGRHVDIALLDAELPDSPRLVAELAGIHTSGTRPVRVIMIGRVPDVADIVEVLRAGVRGWVPKEESIEHLLEVIWGVMRGETWLPPLVVSGVLQLLLDAGCEPSGSRKHPLASLTPRELEVLSYLVQGVSRCEVAESMHLSANTVRSHLQNLMAKLGVHTTLEAVALARRAEHNGTHFRAS